MEKTHKIVVRVNEPMYNFLKSFYPMTISEAVRWIIAGYAMIDEETRLKAKPPIEALKKEYQAKMKKFFGIK